MASSNEEDVQARLSRLKREINTKKAGLPAVAPIPCTVNSNLKVWTDKRKELDKIEEEYELLRESGRVEQAVREWEEMHPPVTEDCPIRLEPLTPGQEMWTGCCFKNYCEPCHFAPEKVPYVS